MHCFISARPRFANKDWHVEERQFDRITHGRATGFLEPLSSLVIISAVTIDELWLLVASMKCTARALFGDSIVASSAGRTWPAFRRHRIDSLAAFFDVGEPVVEQCEDVRGDLFA